MKYNRKPITGYLMALLFAGMAISCSKDQDFEPQPTKPDIAHGTSKAANAIVGDTLAVVNFPNGEFVSFYEFSPGEVAIRHSLVSAPKTGSKNARASASLQIDAKLDRLSARNQSLGDIYKAIATDPNPAVIQRLNQAQTRLATARLNDKETHSSVGKLPSPDRIEASKARAAATGCSPDYFNDNYGAQWFLDNFINENTFRKARVNQAYVGIMTQNKSWTKIAAMAPDYETGIYFSGERWLSCPFLGIGGGCRWEKRWSFFVPARGVELWYIYSDKKYYSEAIGNDPCKRVHLGACNDDPFIYVDLAPVAH
jgi:hypothetical protein